MRIDQRLGLYQPFAFETPLTLDECQARLKSAHRTMYEQYRIHIRFVKRREQETDRFQLWGCCRKVQEAGYAVN